MTIPYISVLDCQRVQKVSHYLYYYYYFQLFFCFMLKKY